jgi:ferredoxin-NADP reductase
MTWLVGTVTATFPETPDAVTLSLDVPDWRGHRPGQHVDLRLTAEDGYTAERSYSIASPPDDGPVQLTIVRIDDGEVSPYLTTTVDIGDQLELRGPIGGWFVWHGRSDAPVLLVGGGSGVVPLMAMLRYHARLASSAPMSLVYSARTVDDILYADELAELAGTGGRKVTITLTREPDGSAWSGRRGRVDAGMLTELGPSPSAGTQCFVCGPTPFVEAVADLLVTVGHPPARVKTERFGPTGG